MKIKLSNFFDATVALGLVTAYLYAFGLAFWRAYYQHFQVEEFVDLSFETTVSGSWFFASLFLLPLLFFVMGNFRQFTTNDEHIHISIVYILFALFTPFFIIVSMRYCSNVKRFILLFISIFLIIEAISILFSIFHKSVLTIKRYRFFILFILYISSSFGFSSNYGEEFAKLLLTQNHRIITLTVEGETQPPQNAIFISHMGSKYIVCPQFESNQDCPKTIVIEDSRVLKAEITTVTKKREIRRR